MSIWADEWDATDDWSGGGAKSKHLVDRGSLLGASLYELGQIMAPLARTIRKRASGSG